jgi:hypothetical protein
MSRKSIILAVAALASLGTIALSSTSASAFGHGGGFGGFHAGGSTHMSSFRGTGFRGGGFGFHRIGYFHPHWYPHYRFGWRNHYWAAPVIATGIAAGYSTAPTWNRCTCLTKEYTPDGAVVFKDLCTQETATNGPANGGPSADDSTAPQQPQQQGYAQQPQGYAQPHYR